MKLKILPFAIALVLALLALAAASALAGNVSICHEGRTLVVSESGALNHLANHATDTLGACSASPST